MNRQDLIAKVTSSREDLDAILARFSDERMEMVILHGEWSVKDLIGHLGYWENRVVFLFTSLKKGESPEPIENADDLNKQALTEFHGRSLGEIRQFEKIAYDNIFTIVLDASDQELFDPDCFAWTGGRMFGEIISDNTLEHYEEHVPEMIQWLKRIA